MVVHDVSARPAIEQFGYWREVICREFTPLTPTRTDDGDGFAGHIELRSLGVVNRAMLGSQPQHVAHGPREIADADGEYYFVNVQLAGRCHVSDGTTGATVLPGQFTIVDTARPYWFDIRGAWRLLSYRIPHAAVPELSGAAARNIARPMDGTLGVGRVLTSFMHALWDVGETPDGVAEGQLQQSFVSTMTAALAVTTTEDTGVEEPQPGCGPASSSLLTAITRFIDAHLGDPGLGVTQVCRAFAISPRWLHYTFAGAGMSFAGTVRRRRLHAVAQELADPATTGSLTLIAARYGMPDPTSFSRAFRREFGLSPRDYRSDHRAGAGG